MTLRALTKERERAVRRAQRLEAVEAFARQLDVAPEVHLDAARGVVVVEVPLPPAGPSPRVSAPDAPDAADPFDPANPPEAPARTGPWSEAEKAQLCALIGEGWTLAEMAETLGRTVQGVARQRKLLGEVAAAAAPEPAAGGLAPEAAGTAAAGEVDDAVTEILDAPVVVPGFDAGVAVPFDETPVPRAVREARARLDNVEYNGRFTLHGDLDLLERHCKGEPLSAIAPDLEVSVAELRARFQRLLPEPTIEAQEAMLGELRRRAAAAEGEV